LSHEQNLIELLQFCLEPDQVQLTIFLSLCTLTTDTMKQDQLQ